VKFKLKALWLADPVPLDVLEVLESFLIPLLDLKIEGQELFNASKRLVSVRMHYSHVGTQSIDGPRKKKVKKMQDFTSSARIS